MLNVILGEIVFTRGYLAYDRLIRAFHPTRVEASLCNYINYPSKTTTSKTAGDET